MRLSYEWLILIILVLLSICLTDSASNTSLTSTKSSQQRSVRQTLKSEQNEAKEPKEQKGQKEKSAGKQQRPRRQQKPTKKKTGVFASFRSLVKDTISDTRVAYRNISKLLGEVLEPPTTPADSAVSASGDNDNITTPAPPGRQQVFDLLGKNYRGLRKLWDTELQTAMRESKKNLKTFQKELKESIRPFLQPANNET